MWDADAPCSDIDAIETLRIREIYGAPLPAYYGRIKSKAEYMRKYLPLILVLPFKVTSIVFGYFKVGRRNNILDVVDLETVGAPG